VRHHRGDLSDGRERRRPLHRFLIEKKRAQIAQREKAENEHASERGRCGPENLPPHRRKDCEKIAASLDRHRALHMTDRVLDRGEPGLQILAAETLHLHQIRGARGSGQQCQRQLARQIENRMTHSERSLPPQIEQGRVMFVQEDYVVEIVGRGGVVQLRRDSLIRRRPRLRGGKLLESLSAHSLGDSGRDGQQPHSELAIHFAPHG